MQKYIFIRCQNQRQEHPIACSFYFGYILTKKTTIEPIHPSIFSIQNEIREPINPTKIKSIFKIFIAIFFGIDWTFCTIMIKRLERKRLSIII